MKLSYQLDNTLKAATKDLEYAAKIIQEEIDREIIKDIQALANGSNSLQLLEQKIRPEVYMLLASVYNTSKFNDTAQIINFVQVLDAIYQDDLHNISFGSNEQSFPAELFNTIENLSEEEISNLALTMILYLKGFSEIEKVDDAEQSVQFEIKPFGQQSITDWILYVAGRQD